MIYHEFHPVFVEKSVDILDARGKKHAFFNWLQPSIERPWDILRNSLHVTQIFIPLDDSWLCTEIPSGFFRCFFCWLVASKKWHFARFKDHPHLESGKSSSNQTDGPMTLGQGPGLNQSEEGGPGTYQNHVSNGKYHVTKFGGENPAKC